MADTPVTVRLVIRGRVQGVGYRAWCMQTARELGLAGWVRNRADRSVEALAHGPAAAVEALVAACRSGPPAARVAGVEMMPAETPENSQGGFQQLPTAAAPGGREA